jgi:NarL family two-component system response regulator LiaR
MDPGRKGEMNVNLSQEKLIRILVVDDHTMVRRGLATFIGVFDDFSMVGEATNGESSIRLCNELNPDIVLMDMVLPDMDGASATRAIKREHPEIRVIFLTSFKDEVLIMNAMQAGAVGYLLKDISENELAQAIRGAMSGQVTFSPEAARIMLTANKQQPVPGGDLTERERAVLELMVEGLNNTQIAQRLFISPATVKSHVSNILSKLNVTGRTEAVALAIRHGLIE